MQLAGQLSGSTEKTIIFVERNPIMESIIIRPKNKKQVTAIKNFLKAFDIPFVPEKDTYNPEFVAKIKESEQQIREGKSTRVTKEDQKEFLGLL